MEKGWLQVKVICILGIYAGSAYAQQGGAAAGPAGTTSASSSTPLSADRDQTVMTGAGSNAQEAGPAKPPMPPLSGAEKFAPGSSGAVRSYLLPAFEWTGYGDTDPTSSASRSGTITQSSYVGSLTLQRAKTHSQLNLDYAGGAFFYSRRIESASNAPAVATASFHEVELFQSVTWSRWELLLGDQLSYLPETPLGFSGFGGLKSFGSGLGGASLSNGPALNPSFQPNQTIETARARRLSNVALTQIQYKAGARTVITASGAYGTLQFLDPGFIDGRYSYLVTGYNRTLSAGSQISAMYIHYLFKFNVPNQEVLNRGLMLAYGRRVKGKLSLQLSAGLLANQIAKPLGGAVTKAFWSTYDSLQYRSQKGGAEISFTRATTGGSGVLLGAESNLAQVTVGRQFLRKFHGSLNLSHAFNQSLVRGLETQPRPKFEFWQAGATLSREFGEHVSFYLNYSAQRQISNSLSCFGGNCGRVLLRQVGGVGINWHGRPIKIK